MKIFISIISIICYLNCCAQNSELWGMTWGGGVNDSGTIFKINEGGTDFSTVYSFTKSVGTLPRGDLLQASNDLLYGMTSGGGVNNVGVIFGFNPTNNTITKLYDFNGINGAYPYGSLIQASNSKLYGMTPGGGVNDTTVFLKGGGVLYCFDIITNTYSKLHDFDSTNGEFPYGSLLQATNGKLYGMTSWGGSNNLGVIFSFDTSTNTYAKLYDFGDFAEPQGTLIQVSNGKLYGMTLAAGTNLLGNIFSFDIPTNTYTDLYDFNGTDGGGPYGSLLQTDDGLLYGMTEDGSNNEGNIFNFDTSGNVYNQLYDFNSSDGAYPQGSLIQASNGELFGMTNLGGNNNLGVIFTIDPSNNNSFSKVFDFNGTNGSKPWGDLIEVNTTGINQLSVNNNQLSIYPNPTSGAITLTSTKNMDEVKVTNLLGQLIYTAKPKQAHFNFEINNEGMFFLTVTAGNETETKKIIVSK